MRSVGRHAALTHRSACAPGSLLEVVSVRPVTAEAWSLWRLLRRQALTESPEAFGTTLAEWSGDGDTEHRWRERLHDVPVNLVAEDAGMPVGMVSVTAAVDGQAEVISMWVAPQARGRGTGEALLRAAISRAATAGATHVALNVRVGNARAVGLYCRVGFTDVGWATAPDAPHAERRMQLDLTFAR